MSWTRRSWLLATLAAALSSVTSLGRAGARPRGKRRPKQGDPGYQTRWIGHY
jgi:hypothetical protein